MKHDTSAHADHDHDNSAMHSGQRLASVPSGGGSNYTCPMHPEVISDKPGSCLFRKIWQKRLTSSRRRLRPLSGWSPMGLLPVFSASRTRLSSQLPPRSRRSISWD
jgi:hypothetical protein